MGERKSGGEEEEERVAGEGDHKGKKRERARRKEGGEGGVRGPHIATIHLY